MIATATREPVPVDEPPPFPTDLLLLDRPPALDERVPAARPAHAKPRPARTPWRRFRQTVTVCVFAAATVTGVVVGLGGATVSPVAPAVIAAPAATTGGTGVVVGGTGGAGVVVGGTGTATGGATGGATADGGGLGGGHGGHR